MPVQKPLRESQLWKPVSEYLKDLGCLVESYYKSGKPFEFINVGNAETRLNVDVYGLQDFNSGSTRHPKALAVEVKARRDRLLFNDLLQASKYGRVAHRCYLAQPCEFDRRAIQESQQVGVGLLKIGKVGRKFIVTLITESKRFEPDPREFDKFLKRALNIGACSFCRSYGLRYPPTNDSDRLNNLAFKDENGKTRHQWVCRKCQLVIKKIASTPIDG